MTDGGNAPRFIVRKGAERDSWMVWDRKVRGPATTHIGLATGLTEGEARQVRDWLSIKYNERG
jgi:hypothetical protein